MNLSYLAIKIKPLGKIAKLDNIKLCELSLVGAGIGGGFSHTAELKEMNHHEVMAIPQKIDCEMEIDNMHTRFEKYKVFMVVK